MNIAMTKTRLVCMESKQPTRNISHNTQNCPFRKPLGITLEDNTGKKTTLAILCQNHSPYDSVLFNSCRSIVLDQIFVYWYMLLHNERISKLYPKCNFLFHAIKFSYVSLLHFAQTKSIQLIGFYINRQVHFPKFIYTNNPTRLIIPL